MTTIQEERRKAHVKEHGSFLYCPDRDTLCAYMEERVLNGTSCRREPCIKDDLEDIERQKRIELKRIENAAAEKHQESAAPIRNQTRRFKSYRQQKLDEIHRLEQKSQEAYRNNNPQLGDTLFNRARIRRGELKKWEDERSKIKNAIEEL